MPKLLVEVSVKKVKIMMRFPCRLQVGFRINEKEVLTDDVIELDREEIQFQSLLTQVVEDEEDEKKGQLVLYAVYAKRKIAVGFITLDLKSVKLMSKPLNVHGKWERSPDKLAFAEYKICVKQNEPQNQQKHQEDQQEVIQIKQTKINTLLCPPTMPYIPRLNIPSSQKICDLLQVPHQRSFNGSSQNISRKKSQNYEFLDKSIQLKCEGIDGFEVHTPVNRTKTYSNSNFLSQEDDQYIKSLKIHIVQPSPHLFNQTLPSPRQKQSSRILECFQSTTQCLKASYPQSRNLNIVQKKLALTQQYYKQQIRKLSKNIIQLQQQRQTLSVQLHLKDDQIKWLTQQLQKLQPLSSSYPTQNLQQLKLNYQQQINRLQDQLSQDLLSIKDLRQKLKKSQKDFVKQKLQYQTKITEFEKQNSDFRQKITMFIKNEQEYKKYLQERDKYISDIKCLVSRVDEQQMVIEIKQKQKQDIVKSKNELEKEFQKVKQQLRDKIKEYEIDEDNIKEFQEELKDKYKTIYQLEQQLEIQKQKSRSLSRSIEGKSMVKGKLFEFSFNHQSCQHNFMPLCNQVKQILSSLRQTHLQTLKYLPSAPNLSLKYSSLQTLLSNFILSLEQPIPVPHLQPQTTKHSNNRSYKHVKSFCN